MISLVFLALLALPAPGRGSVASRPPTRHRAERATVGDDPDSLPVVLGTGRIIVHATRADSGRAARVLRLLKSEAPLPGLPPGLPTVARVFLAPDRASYDALAGERVPEWGAGVAVPGAERIVVPIHERGQGVGTREESRVLRHEWAHLGLHEYLHGLRIPRWFDEGYAEWASGGWDAEAGWRLRLALAGGGAPPMDSLALEWPRGRSSAQLAYMLAGTAVEYLVRRSGERGLTLFLRRWRADRSFETALRGTFGVTTSQLEEDWRAYVKSHYGWLFVLSHSAVVWAFLGLVLLVMAWTRRRRRRVEMARLRASDPAEDAAWWTGGDAETPPGRGEEPGRGGRGPTDGSPHPPHSPSRASPDTS